MGTRSNAASVGADRARRIAVELTSELRRARIDRGLSQADVGRAVGLSGQQVSRIERGLAPDVSITGLCRLLAVVGLVLGFRSSSALAAASAITFRCWLGFARRRRGRGTAS